MTDKSTNLTRHILVPLLIALFAILTSFFLLDYNRRKQIITYEFEKKINSVKLMFKEDLANNAKQLYEIIYLASRDKDLQKYWSLRDRKSLLFKTNF